MKVKEKPVPMKHENGQGQTTPPNGRTLNNKRGDTMKECHPSQIKPTNRGQLAVNELPSPMKLDIYNHSRPMEIRKRFDRICTKKNNNKTF